MNGLTVSPFFPARCMARVYIRTTITGWRFGNQLDVKFFVPPAVEFPKPHSVTFMQDVLDETMKDIGDKPLFRFMSEVRSYKLEAQHDSLFAPPKDYERMK